jgi:hypothetical protein
MRPECVEVPGAINLNLGGGPLVSNSEFRRWLAGVCCIGFFLIDAEVLSKA